MRGERGRGARRQRPWQDCDRTWPSIVTRTTAARLRSAFARQVESCPPRRRLPPSPRRCASDATVIGLVGLAHCVSHFSQLLLPPLFPWLKHEFDVSYTELGAAADDLLRRLVRGAGGVGLRRRPLRAAAGPVRRPGACSALAAFGFAVSTSYAMLAFFSVVAGIGNGVFHPVDYTLLNRKIASARGSAMPTACTASPAAWAGRWRRRCWCRSRWRSWRTALPSALRADARGARWCSGSTGRISARAADVPGRRPRRGAGPKAASTS